MAASEDLNSTQWADGQAKARNVPSGPADLATLCRALVERVPLPLAITEGAAHVLRCTSPAFSHLVGKERALLLDRPFGDAVPAPDVEGVQALLDRAYRTGEAASGAAQRRTDPERGRVYLTFTVWPVLDDRGRPAGLVLQGSETAGLVQVRRNDQALAEIRTINERLLIAGIREQEAALSDRVEAERLAELDRLRADFISRVSHDLQTPLTAIRAGLGLLETSIIDRLRTDERELLGNARRNSGRLSLLIDDLLAINQLETGTLHLDREAFDLRTIATGAVGAVEPLMREKEQTLESAIPEPLPSGGDPRRLEQVLVNLLTNANRYTSAGTSIVVSGRAMEQEVLLSVSDNGPGIPPEELERIFQRFHRLTSAAGGSGLGLAIARAIVELHGGRIWAESTLGEGATFHIALPRHTTGEKP